MVASVAIEVLDREPHDRATRLYEAHAGWLLHYCRGQLRDLADAEDAVQTTFLYAFRALRRGVVPECERAWLTTIARNVCHSQRRTRERHPDTVELELDRIALAEPDHEEAGFLDDVRAALASLPENQRRALVLREWHGASSNEIATELELSEPATHALLFRARRSFATAMSASRRSVAGLNVAVLLDQLRGLVKAFLGGAGAKAAVVTTAAGIAVGGAVIEQRTDGGGEPGPAQPTPALGVSSSPALVPSGPVSPAEPRQRAGTARPRSAPLERRRPDSAAQRARPTAIPTGAANDSFDRPPARATEPPASSAPPPQRSDAPPPAQPGPVPPIEPPVPAPIDLPPILGEDPPIQLPPPVDELLPPVELPPLDLPPLPVPQLPLP